MYLTLTNLVSDVYILRAPLAHPVRQSSEYRTPLAHLQEVAEEIVSEDSLSEVIH